MIFYSFLSLFLFLVLQPSSIESLTTNCQKNRYIDYSQIIETTCLIETCIVSANCTTEAACHCKRDYVVRYNVTIEHDDEDEDGHDDEDDEHKAVHLAVIVYEPEDDAEPIIIGEMYRCFYDERDVTTVFWTRPNRKTYFIILTLCLVLVFAIILVPIIYLMLIIEFTNSDKQRKVKK